MTKEQAYEKLELPAGTDLQAIRQKFQQMHNDFQVQIDGSFSAEMRKRKQQQLEELKEAYAVLNGSESMDDSASLPRTDKTFDIAENEIEAQAPQEGSREQSSAESSEPDLQQALTVFGLRKEQNMATISQTMQQHINDLVKQRNAISLTEVREGYDKAIAKAESAKSTISDWLQERKREEEERQRLAVEEQTQQQQTQAAASLSGQPTTSASSPPTGKKPNTIRWLSVLMLLVTIGMLYKFLPRWRGDSSEQHRSITTSDSVDIEAIRDSATWQKASATHSITAYQSYLDKYSEGIFRNEAQQIIATLQKEQAQKAAEEAHRKKKETLDREATSHSAKTASTVTSGTRTLPDGGNYIGQLRNGKANGQGTTTWSNGRKYTGEWRDDKMHGQGTLTWANGAYYVGAFRDNKMHGQGTFTWKDEQDIGEWRDGKEYNIVRYRDNYGSLGASGRIIKRWVDGVAQ